MITIDTETLSQNDRKILISNFETIYDYFQSWANVRFVIQNGSVWLEIHRQPENIMVCFERGDSNMVTHNHRSLDNDLIECMYQSFADGDILEIIECMENFIVHYTL